VPNGTKTRIFRRMKLGCSKCGYNKTNCDLHHIRGRKVENPHDQSNLCYLCPNCHREAEQGLINADELVSFDVQVGMKWKEYNYGK
jgi:5-methylcytosine-specific restriction endonuclease McrA